MPGTGRALGHIGRLSGHIEELRETYHVDDIITGIKVLLGPGAALTALAKGIAGEALVGDAISWASNAASTRVTSWATGAGLENVDFLLGVNSGVLANTKLEDRAALIAAHKGYTEINSGAKALLDTSLGVLLGVRKGATVDRPSTFRAGVRNKAWNSAAESGAARVTVFRVEGAPNARFAIDDMGNVALEPGNKTVWLNFGQEGRAMSYLDRKVADGLPGTQLKSFEIDARFLDEIRSTAVPESLARRNPGAPILSRDPYPDQFGLRPDQFQRLMESVFQGTGKNVRPR